MRLKLWVDIDDTLILWKKGVTFFDHWVANMPVVKLVNAFDGRVIFWSSGGADHASAIVNALVVDGLLCPRQYEIRTKHEVKKRPGDIFIDDWPLASFAEDCIDPRVLA